MKDIILKVLLENVYYEELYMGGGIEPRVIVFKNSEDIDKEQYLSNISEKIEKEIEQWNQL
jgi:hypothetical protein